MKIAHFFFFALVINLATAQVSFVGDSILVETPTSQNAIDWSIQIQNLDNFTENEFFWSDTGTGMFPAKWCNVRVSRTMWDNDLQAVSEWAVDLKKVDLDLVKVSAMPNRKALVEVQPGYPYEFKTKHTSYGNWQMYMVGNYQYNPVGTHTGKIQVFVPFRFVGEQAGVFTIHAGNCTQSVGRIFYLN